jgi:4-amino-4-deoxy-L-arabinose transferase-like glycosyltransferase
MEVRKRYLFIILAIGNLLFLFNLGGRDLWEPDETRYAVIAREMKETGNWILPHLNGEIYAEKPPLFFWMVNLSTFFLGENSEFSNRLPSALAGLITLFVIFLFGERLFNQRTGFLSAMVLATCIFFPQLSRWMMLDSLVTFFFLLTLYYFHVGVEREERRRKYYLLAGLFMGLGVLTKGPLVYLSLPIFFIFTLLQKNLKKFWCRDLLWGFLLSVIIVLIWWIPACWMGGKDYVHWLLFKHIVGTYIEGGKHFHQEPFYFYFIRFPAEFFPWIVFLPTAFIFGLRREFGKRKEFLFLSLWFIFIFLFFNLSVGKKDNYLLPLYPATAMMVGCLWNLGIKSETGEKWFLFGLLFLVLFILSGIVLSQLEIPQRLYPDMIPFCPLELTVLSYLLVGAILSVLFFIKKKRWASFVSLMALFAFLHLHLSFSLPLRLNPQRSIKAFSERVLKRMEIGDELKTCFLQSNGLIFYTEKPYIENIQSNSRFFEIMNSSRKVFIVIHSRALNQLQKEMGVELFPIDQVKIGHWNYVLISNH